MKHLHDRPRMAPKVVIWATPNSLLASAIITRLALTAAWSRPFLQAQSGRALARSPPGRGGVTLRPDGLPRPDHRGSRRLRRATDDPWTSNSRVAHRPPCRGRADERPGDRRIP